MRKILRRSTSTIDIKVKTHGKAMARKASVISLSDVQDRGRKDLLRNKGLEEICRLGGISVFTLPSDFAVDKLALPTCISATATFLYQHGEAPTVPRDPMS